MADTPIKRPLPSSDNGLDMINAGKTNIKLPEIAPAVEGEMPAVSGMAERFGAESRPQELGAILGRQRRPASIMEEVPAGIDPLRPTGTYVIEPVTEHTPVEDAPELSQQREEILVNLETKFADVETRIASRPPIKRSYKTFKQIEASAKVDGHFRVDLPSRCLAYPFKFVYVRPFRATDIAKLVSAVSTNSFSDFVDVVGAAVNQDIRQLTPSDMRFIMYWLRLNSFVKSPYRISWKSRYGNDNEIEVKSTTLEVIELEMTEEEYAVFDAKGLTLPRVKDSEMFQSEDWSDAEKYLLEQAQYIKINPEDIKEGMSPIQARIDKLDSFEDLSILEDIREFSSLIEHGVIEKVEVVDRKFNAQAAIEYLRDMASNITGAVEIMAKDSDNDPASILALSESAKDYFTEADEIQAAYMESLETKTPCRYVPRKENITLEINAMSFFPDSPNR